MRGTDKMLRQINVEWKRVKSYATEEALMKRLKQDEGLYPEHKDRFLVVRTPEGRWTAVVSLDLSTGGFIGRYEFLKI
jgi:hypothetical protein